MRPLAHAPAGTKPALGPIGLATLLGGLFGLAVPVLFGMSKTLLLLGIVGLCVLAFAVLSGLRTRLFMLLMAFFLPMNLDVHFLDQNLRLSLSSLSALLLWGIWLVDRFSDRAEPLRLFPAISAPAFAFVCATGVSLLAVGSEVGVMFRLFEPLCDFLLYLYFANALRTERAVREVVYALLLGGLFQTGAALAELGLGTELTLNFGQPVGDIWQQSVGATRYARVSGLTEHPNVLAIYLSGLTVFAVSLLFTARRRAVRAVYWVGIALSTFVIVNTFSRSAWALFAVFVPGVFLLNLWKLQSLKKVLVPLLIGLCVLGVGVLSGAVSDRVRDRLEIDDSVLSRVYMMEIGVDMVKANPVFGVGLKNYHKMMYAYDHTDIAITSVFPGTLHNVFLLIASEQGLLGLAAFVWLSVAIIAQGRHYLRADVSFLSGVGLSAWCSIVMLLLFGMANPFPRYSYMYLPLGILVAASHLMKTRPDGSVPQLQAGAR
jgi:O-antigen ligase